MGKENNNPDYSGIPNIKSVNKSMYRYLKQRLKHVVRFRNKRGYGVHSPFMFNLILNVIRDKERQFSYPEAREKELKMRHYEKKLYRLLFRLIRFLGNKKILCVGTNVEVLADYLRDGKEDTLIGINQPEMFMTADFIYIGRDVKVLLRDERFSALDTSGRQKRCVVISDIYKNSFNMQMWLQLRQKATVSVDMMWYGILFFDEKLQNGKYSLII